MINYLAGLDKSLFYFINHSLKNIIFDIAMPIITTQGYWALPVILAFVVLAVFGKEKGRDTFFLCLIALIISDSVTNHILKPFFHRQRPFEVLDNVNLFVNAYGYSFPSSHAVNMFTSAITISYIWRKNWIRILVFGIACIVGFSRIYVGVHYPSDVCIGIVFSILFSIIAIWLFNNLKTIIPKIILKYKKEAVLNK